MNCLYCGLAIGVDEYRTVLIGANVQQFCSARCCDAWCENNDIEPVIVEDAYRSAVCMLPACGCDGRSATQCD